MRHRKWNRLEANEFSVRLGSMDNNERIVFGKRVVSGEGIRAQIRSENKQLVAISLVILFGVGVTFGVLFSYHPPSTSSLATPADTVYYGNEYYVNESGYDALGLWLGTVNTLWTFGYDTSVGQFVLNGNTFFSTSHSNPWYGSAVVDGSTNTPTTTDLSSSTQYTISGSTGTIINDVVAAGNYEVGTYGYTLGQQPAEILFVVPLDE